MTKPHIKSTLDSTFLAKVPEAAAVVRALCHSAAELELRAVCVRPEWVSLAKSILEGTRVKIATVIAFPEATTTVSEQSVARSIGVVPTNEKCREIETALLAGADELDIVLNTAFYQQSPEQCQESVALECEQLVQAANGRLIKLIFDCDLLSSEQFDAVAIAALASGIGCLKNATGFITDGHGATSALVAQMRQLADRYSTQNHPDQRRAQSEQRERQRGDLRLVKASGGVRTFEAARMMQKSGADIIGTSAAKAICETASYYETP